MGSIALPVRKAPLTEGVLPRYTINRSSGISIATVPITFALEFLLLPLKAFLFFTELRSKYALRGHEAISMLLALK